MIADQCKQRMALHKQSVI